MDLMTFGSYLKWAREELDMTQQELAEIIDCAFSTISRIETGKNCPSLKTFRSLNVVFEGFVNSVNSVIDGIRQSLPQLAVAASSASSRTVL